MFRNPRRSWILFRFTIATFILCLAVLGSAQFRTGPVQVLVTPDHADWKYAPGESAVFSVKALKNGNPLAAAGASWAVGPELLPPIRTGSIDLSADGAATVNAGTRRDAGFLRFVVTVADEGRSYRGMCTVGFAPEQIRPVVQDPEGFDSFWQEGKDALAKIPIAEQRTPYPEKSTATLDAYQVSFQNVAGPSNRGASRIYGILTEPKAPGKYPALLRLPGAGVYGVSGIVKEALEDTIVLSIGIHGIPLTLDASVYNSISRGAIDTYYIYNIESRDMYYYRRVYLGCVRAVDYLAALPNWDGKTLAVIGSSQGGALAIVTAALHPRVGALASIHPALSDSGGYVQDGRAGGWPPELFQDPANRTKERLDNFAFYDVVNFARRVKVPGIYSWGYNDETCPPVSTYSSYNVITAPKVLTLQLETGHWIAPEQNARIMRWVGEYLKTGITPFTLIAP
ncbi:MAG TPA: acetylxylan esterase [Acidobacteriota bacterium]|nr:acetylxylan esterase [Acidobacteriota bacterium]